MALNRVMMTPTLSPHLLLTSLSKKPQIHFIKFSHLTTRVSLFPKILSPLSSHKPKIFKILKLSLSAKMAGQSIVGLGHDSTSRSSSLQPLELLLVLVEGNFLQPPPPLPIRSCPFRFLTQLDLGSVGKKVEEVPFIFGWKLVDFGAVKSGVVELHIRDIGEYFGLKYDVSVFLMEKRGIEGVGSDGSGSGTGLEACSQGTSESVREIFEISQEAETEQTLAEAFPKIKRRFKVPAGRTDLSFARSLKRARTQTTQPKETKKPSSSQTTQSSPSKTKKPSPRSTRRSLRLALPVSARKPRKGTSGTQVPTQVQDISSSPEELSETPENTLQEQGSSPFPEGSDTLETTPIEQGPTPVSKPAVKCTPKSTSKPVVKRTPKRKQIVSSDSEEEYIPTPPTKKAKSSASVMVSPNLEIFLTRHVVRGKIFKVSYFEQQGLDEFIEKIKVQGWLELFTNINLRCSGHELAEFYSNCSIEDGVVVSRVGGKTIQFDAEKLGSLLGVPSTGFSMYVREDTSALETGYLLDITRRLCQDPSLVAPRPIQKGEMTPLHQLFYWFVLKNIIPRGQGRSRVDVMVQCLIDLLARGEQINLPALMIKHIERISKPSKKHDLAYGFLLTMVFDSFGVPLTKPAGVTFLDEIGSSTLLGCGFTLVEGARPEQGSRTPCPSDSTGSSLGSTVANLVQANAILVAEVSKLKSELNDERAETITRYENLLALLRSLTSPQPPPPPAP